MPGAQSGSRPVRVWAAAPESVASSRARRARRRVPIALLQLAFSRRQEDFILLREDTPVAGEVQERAGAPASVPGSALRFEDRPQRPPDHGFRTRRMALSFPARRL